MSNLLVKHSCSLSPAKLLYREYGGTPIATKFRPCCKGESLNRNPLLRRKSERSVDAVHKAPLERREIIVVDDCSQDGTRIVLQQRLSQVVHRIIYHAVNRGEGAALRSGFAAATVDMVLVQDADVEYNPEDYPALLEPLMSGKADAVFGSRFMGARPHRVLFFWHMVGTRFLNLLSNMFTNPNLTDIETGYKLSGFSY